MPERLQRLDRLCLLARRELVDRPRARAERQLDVHAVDPRHPRVADDLDRAVAGDELAELLERTRLDVDAPGGEHGAFEIARAGVCRAVVERLPLLVERPESRLVLRERPVAAADAAPRFLGVDLDQDRHGSAAQRPSDLVGADGAAAERDHRGRRGTERRRARRLDSRSRNAASPPVSKIRAIGSSPLDFPVDIDERSRQPLRECGAERRLAGAHEADQCDMTV